MIRKILLIIVVIFVLKTLGFAQDLTPEQIYEKVNDCVVVIHSYDFNGKFVKQGSGVVISDKGWVVTNYHVFADCEKVEIKHNDKIISYSDIIVADIDKDILIIKIAENTFRSIKIGDDKNLKVGQKVYAIGSPLGLENSMSEGIISGLRNVSIENKNYIQITAGISPGSSGGAVVNSKGELIGISTSSLVQGQNLNFAIPISEIQSSFISYNEKDNNNFFKGYNALNSKKYNEAVYYLTLSIEENPKLINAIYNRGVAYYEKSRIDSALMDFNKVIKTDPNDDKTIYFIGLCYQENKNFYDAIKYLKQAIEINRNKGEYFNALGESYKELNNYSLARENYIIADKLGFESMFFFSNIAECCRKLKLYDEALKYYDEIIKKHDFLENIVYMDKGHIYMEMGYKINAIEMYTKSVTIRPSAKGYIYRGNAYFDLKNFTTAINDYTKAIELFPNYEEAFLRRGNAYLEISEDRKAIEDYITAIGIKSNYADAYYGLGSGYYNIGDNTKAIQYWEYAIKLNPSFESELRPFINDAKNGR